MATGETKLQLVIRQPVVQEGSKSQTIWGQLCILENMESWHKEWLLSTDHEECFIESKISLQIP